jgi:hypothetical protein
MGSPGPEQKKKNRYRDIEEAEERLEVSSVKGLRSSSLDLK